jgi:hypothetical protein
MDKVQSTDAPASGGGVTLYREHLTFAMSNYAQGQKPYIKGLQRI